MGGQDSQVAEQDDQEQEQEQDQDRDANKSTGTTTIVWRRQHLARWWEKLESRVALATTQGHLPIRQRITTGILSALLSIRSGSFQVGMKPALTPPASTSSGPQRRVHRLFNRDPLFARPGGPRGGPDGTFQIMNWPILPQRSYIKRRWAGVDA
jgi:hypothetical protein